MRFIRSSARSSRSRPQILGVVLLLLMYMAQPVLALQGAFCGCSSMMSSRVCACSAEDLGPADMGEASSCCVQKVQESAEASCCSGGGDTDAESVCHCPPQPVDSIPSGVVFDGQACAGPFVWWAELEAQASESRPMAPHLGGVNSVEGSQNDRYLDGPSGGVPEQDRGPTGPAARRLRAGGMIAFLADLSVAKL